MVGQILFVLVGGVWSDRLPRQRVLIGSDVLQAATYGVLALVLVAGSAQVWQLAAARLVAGIAGAFFLPASGGIVPELVPTSLLQQANALLGLSRSVTSVGGPALAGVLVALSGPGLVFAIDAVSFVVSAALLLRLRVPNPRVTGERESFARELADGWKAVISRPWYPVNLMAHALWSCAIAFFFVLGPVVAQDQLGGAAAWGLISAAIGVGLVVGGVVALRYRPRRPLLVGNLALVPAVAPLLALAMPYPAWVIAALTAVAYAGLAFLNEVWGAVVGELYPSDILARVESYDWLFSIIAMPLGYAMAGPVADQVGTGPALAGAALLLGLPSLAVCALPGVRGLRRGSDGRLVESAGTTG